MERRSTTFRLRPWAAMPTYIRAATSSAGFVIAKKLSRRSGPGGGKTSVSFRSNNARICVSALRTVAVLAMILGRIVRPSRVRDASQSMAAS